VLLAPARLIVRHLIILAIYGEEVKSKEFFVIVFSSQFLELPSQFKLLFSPPFLRYIANECVIFRLRIRDALGSNLSRQFEYPEGFRGSPQPIYANAERATQNRLQQLPPL
jgi:hypothetical protein